MTIQTIWNRGDKVSLIVVHNDGKCSNILWVPNEQLNVVIGEPSYVQFL
jgi:thiamine kinase-like enzyme